MPERYSSNIHTLILCESPVMYHCLFLIGTVHVDCERLDIETVILLESPIRRSFWLCIHLSVSESTSTDMQLTRTREYLIIFFQI